MVSLSRRDVGKALVALTLTGCGAAGVPETSPKPLPTKRPSPNAASGREPTTIRWSFWGDQKEIEINQRIVSAFQAVHPEIRVEARHDPWATYFTRLQSDWSRREAPDVMFLNNIPIYARTGALENLEPLIARDHYPVADFYPALLSTFRYGANLHGLPRDNDTKVIYVNKKLFAEAGVAPPTADWTWEEFRRSALKLTRRGADGVVAQWGFAYEVNSWWRIWVWQNNGDILDDHFQPTRVRLDEPASVEAIQFLADLTNVDGVTPPYDRLNGDAQRSLFREGRVAMILDNHSFVPSAAETPGLEWDVAPLPRGRRRANLAGGAGFAISAYSTRKEAAWTFFKFLQGAEGQALFAEAGVSVPARRSIREENIFQRRKPYNVAVFYEETEHGVDNYYFPKATEMDAYLDEALAPVFQGKEPAADAVRRSLPRLTAMIAPTAG